MKKIMLLAVLLNTLSGCQMSDSKVVELKEKMFIVQTNEIYMNRGDYLGKTIKYEGIFKENEIPAADTKSYSVIRYVSYCCSIDGTIGFEVKWDSEYPNIDDWVEAIGVLEEYSGSDGRKYLRLELSSLKTLPTRGAEIVFKFM